MTIIIPLIDAGKEPSLIDISNLYLLVEPKRASEVKFDHFHIVKGFLHNNFIFSSTTRKKIKKEFKKQRKGCYSYWNYRKQMKMTKKDFF